MQDNRRRTTDRAVRGVFADLFDGQVTITTGQIARNQQSVDAQQAMPGQGEGLYIISVAARILSMHPQTLRKYERVGLVRPSRTVGMLRLYSEEDIIKLRVIKRLVDELRLNLAGVEMAMAVFDRLSAARQEMSRRVSAQAFDRLFEQIMELFEGPSRSPRQSQRDED